MYIDIINSWKMWYPLKVSHLIGACIVHVNVLLKRKIWFCSSMLPICVNVYMSARLIYLLMLNVPSKTTNYCINSIALFFFILYLFSFTVCFITSLMRNEAGWNSIAVLVSNICIITEDKLFIIYLDALDNITCLSRYKIIAK